MRPTASAAVCAALLLAFGARAQAAEPTPEDTAKDAPVKTEPKSSVSDAPAYPPPITRWGVIGIGLATTGALYGIGAGMSYAFPDAPGAEDLRTPVIGPWMAIANNGCAAGDTECSKVWIAMRSIATAIGGLGQAGGLLVALEGVFMPTQYAPSSSAPRAPSAPNEPSKETPKPTDKPNEKNLFWMPTPMAMGAGGVGMGVVGRF